MRYIKPHCANKQNKENVLTGNKQREKLQVLKMQLRDALGEISWLKECHHNLANKLQIAERESQKHSICRDEVQFLREREQNVKVQLDNYDQINRKLRQELQKSERQRMRLQMQLKKASVNAQQPLGHLQPQRQSNPYSDRFLTKRNRNIDVEVCSMQSSNKNTSKMSCHTSLAKENHFSTPKSKVKINLQQFMPEPIPQRRKVFF